MINMHSSNSSAANQVCSIELDDLLKGCADRGASDLHLSTNCPPIYRIDGAIHSDNQSAAFTDACLRRFVEILLSSEQLLFLEKNQSIDTGHTAFGTMRFRINVYYERGSLAIAARWLEGIFSSFNDLRLPSQLVKFTEMRDGLVLVTGATGSGKSTTLATMINEINESCPFHILTIEDPIEFIHPNKQSIVHQREIGRDVPSFAMAIRAAMREDPDVILLGEMRDTETIRAALTAAETGHLVFSTLHTNDAAGVIDRMIGAFPSEEQDSVRQQLSMVLRGVVSQMLVKVDGGGRVPINEILFVDNAVSHLIRKHRPEQIRSVMETGRAAGNQSFDFALAKRVQERLMPKEQALRLTTKEQHFNELLKILQEESRLASVRKRSTTAERDKTQ
jgi:twitching motility protein PilT